MTHRAIKRASQARGAVAAAAAVATAYLAVVRPRLLRAGATAAEANGPYPGAGLIPDGTRSGTMAVTIDAPRSRVWAWLAQMGTDRAGWYSWDRLDNFGRASARTIHPEWLDIAVGDHLAGTPDGSQWWEVAALEPERFLGLRMSLDLRGRPFDPAGQRPRYFTDSLWGFELKDAAGGRARLVVSGYWSFRPKWLQPILSVLLLEPSHWVMQTRQFTNLKRRTEPEGT
ncbi:hypothetical protein [Arthrobacter sp. AL12]|uniref:hypothetical protein n=1 Tax=Arthrobacter sp. AL12 TaxID=3042241 RepID=UPI00249A416A|nr:hypothetical protein [Arthrobacter sp. AL12]MDI3213988.1 hypothetical protein [Arthrobacter sp. AL12]